MITNEEILKASSFKELVELRHQSYKDLSEKGCVARKKISDSLKIFSIIGSLSAILGTLVNSVTWFNRLKWGLRFMSLFDHKKR